MKGYLILVIVALIFILPLALSAPASRPSFEVADSPEPTFYEFNFTTLFDAGPGTPIGINTSVADASGISSTQAVIKNSTGDTVALVELYDNGLSNDGAADDGIYGGIWDTTGNLKGWYPIDILVNDTLGNSNVSEGLTMGRIVYLYACVDGTPIMTCSEDKPKFCNALEILLDDYCYGPDTIVGTADDCGCPGVLVCQSDGTCI